METKCIQAHFQGTTSEGNIENESDYTRKVRLEDVSIRCFLPIDLSISNNGDIMSESGVGEAPEFMRIEEGVKVKRRKNQGLQTHTKNRATKIKLKLTNNGSYKPRTTKAFYLLAK